MPKVRQLVDPSRLPCQKVWIMQEPVLENRCLGKKHKCHPNIIFDCKVCGKRVGVYLSPAQLARRSRGWFCSRACSNAYHAGERSNWWKGGRIITTPGYVKINQPQHPNADAIGFVCEHRLVMEKHLGRTLTEDEVVHHINKDKLDNRLENLMLFPNHSAHVTHHNAIRRQTKEYHEQNEQGDYRGI